MFVTNWISTTKIQKISEITNFFRHYFLSRTEVIVNLLYASYRLKKPLSYVASPKRTEYVATDFPKAIIKVEWGLWFAKILCLIVALFFFVCCLLVKMFS